MNLILKLTSYNFTKQNEWTSDIKKQKEKIKKNEIKLYDEADKYKIENWFTEKLLTYSLRYIMNKNKRKLRKY